MGSIRIIAGRFRGRVLRVPDVPGLRPTGSKVRGALFNILGQDLTGRSVLDLYAGTGALGFEAVSRGASRVVCVEADRGLATGLRRSAEALGIGASLRVVAGRVEDVLGAGSLTGPFDVILADPPYGTVEPGALAKLVDRAGLLRRDGILAVEGPRGQDAAEGSETLTLVRSERYGSTSLSFFEYRKTGSSLDKS
jgi:16S rRNA (guanine966-N2)-methyltransferase